VKQATEQRLVFGTQGVSHPPAWTADDSREAEVPNDTWCVPESQLAVILSMTANNNRKKYSKIRTKATMGCKKGKALLQSSPSSP